ncbi:MAG: outer membrane beta-barrel family protein [Bacteroidota bacterium]
MGTEFNPIGTTLRTDDEEEDESKLEYALTYTKKLKGKGHELVGDIRFQDNVEKESSDFLETYFDPDMNPTNRENLFQRSANEEGERRLITRLDYTRPFGKKEKLELGYQGSFRMINNDYKVEELVNGEYQSLPNLTNEFNYDENIYGVYATYGNKINKFSFSVGARVEHSDVRTELVNNDSINARNYTNLFPSAFVAYELGSGNSIQVSYSRRVRRPRFWDLNPFFTFSDARNQFSGNPNLDPEFTDSYELGHVKIWEKGSLSSAIFYRHTTDVIARIVTSQVADTTFRRPENLTTQDDIGLEFTFSYNPVKWVQFNGDVNLFRSVTDGSNLGDAFQADTYTARGRLTTRGTIRKKTDVQIRLNYRAPRETTQGRDKSITFLDLGLSHDVFNNNGTITFNVSDLFQSRRRRSIIETENFYREDDFQWRGRTFRLTLNYRLNQKNQRGRGSRRGGGGNYGGGEEF